ncbi:MAG: cation:proton antiporter, partial [Planctomycetia bacterium]|nr:cation:proton antiporter [Planctomycetia bacterium]
LGAKLGGELAKKYGQPAVLGELLMGVLLGGSLWALFPGLGEVGQFLQTVGAHISNAENDSTAHLFHMLGELGVAILLLEIGLETDLKRLISVGPAALVVAFVGVFLPFGLGYLVAVCAGFSGLVPLVCGAALTATSIGITARVFSELGRLQDPESQIVLGAAVIDDVIGLIILAVVGGIVGGGEVGVAEIGIITGKAVGFLTGAILIGSFVVPPTMRWIMSFRPQRGTITVICFVFALILSVLARQFEVSMILGAFSAGLLLAKTPQAHALAEDIAFLGRFFVPIFFISVGSKVDLQSFGDLKVLELGGLMLLVAIIGKFAAGYAPFWFRGSKMVIGVGMIPRGEVGLIFCSMGISSGVFTKDVFSAMTFMVMLTTFVTPPALKFILQRSHANSVTAGR